MHIKRIFSGIFCISILVLLGWNQRISERSMEMETIQVSTRIAEQTAISRAQADLNESGRLMITKKAAPGTKIPDDLFFPIQVRLGDELLPVGSLYLIGDIQRTVETAGILMLRVGETAVIEREDLSGMICHVTELASSFDGYRASYSGEIKPKGTVVCNEDGATGIIPPRGTIHIKIENADYDFAIQIPVRKNTLDFQQKGHSSLQVEQVEKTERGWRVIETLPESVIAANNSQIVEDVVTIGYRFHEEGMFYYRVTEISEGGNYLCDRSVFIVEVTVSGGAADITGIRKVGGNTESVTYINCADTFQTGDHVSLPKPAEKAGCIFNWKRFFLKLLHLS